MRSESKSSILLCIALSIACPGLLSTRQGSGQSQDQAASSLIKLLTGAPEGTYIIPCGETEEDRNSREVAQSLVRQGASALPEIERTLDWVEARDGQSEDVPNSRLILEAYVRIKGTGAYPRIQEMIDHASRPSLQLALDDSVAVLFSLTSFVSFRTGKTVLRTHSISTCRAQEPRDGLDRLIIAWEGNDRAAVENSLAWSARGVLNGLLSGRTWQGLRTELWRGPSGGRIAMGYRFETKSKDTIYGDPGIDTVFKNGAGSDCGRVRVKFAGVPALPGWDNPKDYVVDNSDLASLLGIMSACAADSAKAP